MSCAGDLLEGRYELEAMLGAGGTARVFRATDLVTKAIVAIKLMDAGREQDPEALAYFRQEGRLAARIRDPHLVPALHFGVDEGRHFIVYDYLPGSAPLTVLADLGRVAPRRVCELALQVLYALDTLHRASVVHGDVSLNNCLWRERDGGRDEVRLCDLGSAWARSPCSAVSGGPTKASDSRGTAYCTAPELMLAEAGDHRADLWSVGAMMYALMTMRDVDLGDPEDPFGIPPPALLVPKISRAISDVVMRALAPADERYPSATAMIEAIRAVLAIPPAKRGVPLWASIAGMAVTAGLACSLANMADTRDDASPTAPAMATVAAGLGLRVEGRPPAELPAAGDMRALSELAPGPEAGPVPTDAPEAAAAAIELERHADAGPAAMDAPEAGPAAIEPKRQEEMAPTVGQSEQAANWSLCMKYNAVLFDTNLGEDYDTVGNANWPARGAKVRVFSNNAWGPFLNTSTTTGCFNFNFTSPAAVAVIIELHAEHTLVNGQKVAIRNDWGNTKALKVWSFTAALSLPGGTVNFVTPQSPESNIAAIVPTVVQRISGLTGNITAAANKFVDVYPQNILVTGSGYGSAYKKSINTIFIAQELDHDAFKFLVGHEVGHFLERFWGGDVSVGNLSYVPNDDIAAWCDFDGLGDHAMFSREEDTVAYKEGAAHFISAAAWNDIAQTNGKFKNYKDEGFYNNDLIDLNAAGGFAFDWEGSMCSPKILGESVEGDWTRFFWNYVTDAADPQKPTMANLAAHINKLYTVAGLTDTNCYTHFVDTIDDAGQVALTTRFTTKAATHGVNDP